MLALGIGFFFGYSVCVLAPVESQSGFAVVVSIAGFLILALVFILLNNSRLSVRIKENDMDESRTDTDDDPTLVRRNETIEAISAEAQLSPRQREVFALLAKGRNAQHIAEKLFISLHTSKAHIYRIYRKLDVHTQQELMDYVDDYSTSDHPSSRPNCS